MNKSVSHKMNSLRALGEKALIPYFMAGHTDLKTFAYMLQNASKAGADLVEVGVPFSDPVADGPVIQKAGMQALKNGVTLKTVLEVLNGIKDKIDVPIILMSYANPIVAYGIRDFFEDAANADVTGLIIPDSEIAHERDLLVSDNIERIRLIAPNTSVNRIKAISSVTQGFLYAVSVTGTTGIMLSGELGWGDYIANIRKSTNMPVCAGFGISTPQEAAAATKYFDGVICGSALLRAFDKNGADGTLDLISDMKKAVSSTRGRQE